MLRLPVGPDGTAHATTISFQTDSGPRAVLICGPSGTGKSALGLALIGLGGDLVADDRTVLRRRVNTVEVEAPATIRGLIEARGVGLLRAPSVGPVPLGLVVDLAQSETARLPPSRRILVDEVAFPCLFRVAAPYFAVAVRQYLRFGTVPQET